MSGKEIITASANYIETHLKEDLSIETLAAVAGYSPYYYCRLFTMYMGMPVMEYIRRRRLARAAVELWEGKRIIDVALDCGFESHNGFAKAFRKVYGFSPDEYRRRVSIHRPPAPNPIANLVEPDYPSMPQIRIERRPGFYVAGLIRCTLPALSSVTQLPTLWKEMRSDELDNRIYAMAQPEEHGEYYMCFPVSTGLFRYVQGVKVNNVENLDPELYVDWIPGGLYGIFSPAPTFGSYLDFADNIDRTWKYIYSQWLPSSGYAPDPNGLDYEFYDERCHGDGPYTMDICVPLIKKDKIWHIT